MLKYLAALLALGLLAGCVSEAPVHPATHAGMAHPGPIFDPRAARYILGHGPNVVDGQAVIRDASGPDATCAGDSATLVPDTAYTRARLNALYGVGRDYAEISTAPRPPRDARYEAYVRHARCDQDGRFRFGRLADGHYVVVAAVRRPGESRAQGVSIRQLVAVHGGETQSVVLTH